MPAGIGGMPRSVNRASERQSCDELALALHDVHDHAGLAVRVGRELLGRARRDGRVPQDDLLDHPAHRLDAERERDDVEQQHVVAAALVERVGLDRGAERDHGVGVEVA